MTNLLKLQDIPVVDLQTKDTCRDPSIRLMLAILEDALLIFQRGLNSPLRSQRQQFHEVDSWIRSDDADWVFSFENICGILDIDPDYIRGGLQRLKQDAFSSGNRCTVSRLRRERIYDRRAWPGHIKPSSGQGSKTQGR